MLLPARISARRLALFAFRSLLLAASFLHAAELVPPTFDEPKVAPASNEAELAMKRFVLQPGFKVELFAAEPLLANPVAFHIDHRGRFLVCETFRHGAGVTDIRGHMNWLDEDLASRSVEDRLAMLKRHEGRNFINYSRHSDRLRLVWDSNNDDKADSASVFADGFTNALSGIGSGVLSMDGDVFYANLPDLWLLNDTNDDGKADLRKSLLYGFGVRVGFLGHDLHGLTLGPDGKIYFTIGDRGASIIQGDRRVGEADTGAVYRCNPDGSDLEVFCSGLRNPQEIAFDEFGNLFTVDNNSDGGDRARLLYLIEGADYGWRIGFQFLERPNSRGMWNFEKMWHPAWEGQAAYLLPAITNLTDGPSGLAYYPGTGFPDKFKGRFMIVDFHGGKGSGIFSFSLKPHGAGFAFDHAEKFIWESLPTDVDFGPDGSLYFTDWVQGWATTGKGRIYKVTSIENISSQLVAETKQLLLTSMQTRKDSALAALLIHPNRNVRQRSQMELVRRGQKSAQVFAATAEKSTSAIAKVHSAWGLGILSRSANQTEKKELLGPVLALLNDKDSRVPAQAAKVLGDASADFATDSLIAGLASGAPAVRLQCSLALGKMKAEKAIPFLFQVLRENNNKDPYLRHAASMALAWIGNVPSLLNTAKSDSAAVRMGAVLALRRLERSEIATFLHDSDPLVVAEVGRAINDVPIAGAMADLAAFKQQSASSFPVELARRVVNANYRAGTRDTASRLVTLAEDDHLPAIARSEALANLANWELPAGRDRITGLWRPIVGARQASDAVEALKPALPRLISFGPEMVRLAAIDAAAALHIPETGEALTALVKDPSAGAALRVQALRTLARLRDPRLADLLQTAVSDSKENLRKEALRIQSRTQGSAAIGEILRVLESGTLGEKQSALGTLGHMSHPAADEIILKHLEELIAGEAPKELELDILDAASKRQSDAIKSKLAAHESSLPQDDELAPFRSTLFGGNFEEGRKIFIERAEAACLRCHKIPEAGGGEVGPDLSKSAAAKSREYLLESIVLPNKHIAEGFESLIVESKDGLFYAGVVKSENDAELVLNSPEDGIVTVKQDQIVKRTRGASAMPEGLATLLSRKDLRDLIEFLAQLK